MSYFNGNPSDWGGLTICGNATTTAGVDAEAEIGGFIYGGTNDVDNSGVINNLVIATITNLYLSGYNTNIDMKDNGALSNVQIDGANTSSIPTYDSGTQVNILTWTWRQANL